jgi:hypothetical protein
MASHRRSTSTQSRRTAPPPSQVARRAAARKAIVQRQPSFIERYRGGILAGVLVAILIALAVIFVVKFGPSNQGKEAASGAQPADPALVAALTQIPASEYDAVGIGSAAANPPKAITGATPLQQNGKPELLYVGAEYCPYCAAERWAMIAALSRFGTFSNLSTIRSSSSDVYPNTPTFSFYGSSYTSDTIAFTPVEQYTNQPSGNGYTPLQNLTPEQQSIVNKYDAAPYTAGGIPFVNFGNQLVFSGATYDPGILADMSWQQIAAELKNPNSSQAQGIIGSANLITAGICEMTSQQPASVCSSAGVQSAAKILGKS